LAAASFDSPAPACAGSTGVMITPLAPWLIAAST
jgi:hypothetical protein